MVNEKGELLACDTPSCCIVTAKEEEWTKLVGPSKSCEPLESDADSDAELRDCLAEGAFTLPAEYDGLDFVRVNVT